MSAIGNVAFPRLAAMRAIPAAGRGLPMTALLVSAVTASAILLPIAAIAFWLIPEVFGPAYRDAVPLLWILTPGEFFWRAVGSSVTCCADSASQDAWRPLRDWPRSLP